MIIIFLSRHYYYYLINNFFSFSKANFKNIQSILIRVAFYR